MRTIRRFRCGIIYVLVATRIQITRIFTVIKVLEFPSTVLKATVGTLRVTRVMDTPIATVVNQRLTIVTIKFAAVLIKPGTIIRLRETRGLVIRNFWRGIPRSPRATGIVATLIPRGVILPASILTIQRTPRRRILLNTISLSTCRITNLLLGTVRMLRVPAPRDAMLCIPAPRDAMLSVAITDTTMTLNPTRTPITPMTQTITHLTTRPSTPRPRTITRTCPGLGRPRPLPGLSVAITDTTMALNPTRMPITPMTRTITHPATRPSTPKPRTITRTRPRLNRPRPLPRNSRRGIRTIRALSTMSTIRDDAPQPLQLHSSPRTRTHLTKLLEPITQIMIPITNIPQTKKLPKLSNPQRKVRRQLPQHLETKFARPSTSSKSNNIRKHAPKGPMRISPPRVPTDHVLRHLTHSFSSLVITLSRFRRNRVRQCTTRSQATKEIPCLTSKLRKPTPLVLSRPRVTT